MFYLSCDAVHMRTGAKRAPCYHRLMKPFLFGVLFTVIALPALAFLYIKSGYVPVATSAPPFPFEKKIAQTALAARIAHEAPSKAAVDPTPENLVAGAKLYREYCAVCHGTPDKPKTTIAAGMYPPPPQLFPGKGVTDDPVGETYWKVANGIRLTGMPAFAPSLNDTQVWQVSQMLANANHLSPEATASLTAESPAK